MHARDAAGHTASTSVLFSLSDCTVPLTGLGALILGTSFQALVLARCSFSRAHFNHALPPLWPLT